MRGRYRLKLYLQQLTSTHYSFSLESCRRWHWTAVAELEAIPESTGWAKGDVRWERKVCKSARDQLWLVVGIRGKLEEDPHLSSRIHGTRVWITGVHSLLWVLWPTRSVLCADSVRKGYQVERDSDHCAEGWQKLRKNSVFLSSLDSTPLSSRCYFPVCFSVSITV